MSEATNNDEKFLSASVIAGVSVPIVESVAMFAHGGVIGGIVALGVSGLVWAVADEMAKNGRGVTLPASSQPSKVKRSGKQGFLYRALNGKDFRDEQDDSQGKNNECYVQLGPQLWIHIDDLLSNRIAILGMPGQGKSNAVAKFCEVIAPFEPPLIIYDSKPEYTQLCQAPYFLNPYRVNASNLSPEQAKGFGIILMENRLQAVVDLTSYEADQAAMVMIGINSGIRTYETVQESDARLPVVVVLDEAHIWLPQSGSQSIVSKEKDENGRSLFTRLQNSFIWLVNTGRSFGIASIISTQRPANIDKRIIAPAEWKLLLKANMPNDLAVYKEFGLDKDEARKLSVGQAHIVGPGDFSEGAIYQIGKRQSPDAAKTPGLANLRKSAKSVPVTGDVDDDSDTLQMFPTASNSRDYSASAGNNENSQENSVETAPQARLEPVTDDLFPAYQETETMQETPPQRENTALSPDKMETIRRMKEAGYPDREIAQLTGLSGRKYSIYKQYLAALGYSKVEA
jgi:Helicase HerA, central domain